MNKSTSIDLYRANSHQQEQIKVINSIADQLKSNDLNFSTVDPVDDYDSDSRICLTSVHFPKQVLIDQITRLVNPLKKIEPNHYYYRSNSLHITIKNIRVVSNPPHFSDKVVEKVINVFDYTVSRNHKFMVYFYRLLMFPAHLALVGTSDPELDNIFLALDKNLTNAGVPDDKKYANKQHFFSNITLLRFTQSPSYEMVRKINEFSKNVKLRPYEIDSISLIKANTSLSLCDRIKTWQLN